jgi:hypothetical protein
MRRHILRQRAGAALVLFESHVPGVKPMLICVPSVPPGDANVVETP